ncbi:unnamed protein product [Danaus chrysippus]|uniref:(African queen) hypothetical protein n=1 Tax=Danaus chrysippus TaxID=151541 RepID=A0A8J2WDI7_9NEOP|nr:unnamed protein product [Danaus chrysippus]
MSRCRSVGRSRRVGVGAGSRNECTVLLRRARFVAPTRSGIFDANFGNAMTADYTDAVREGSHPKAEKRVGRADVITRLSPLTARSRRTHHTFWSVVYECRYVRKSNTVDALNGVTATNVPANTVIDHAMFTFCCHGNVLVTNGDAILAVSVYLIKP